MGPYVDPSYGSLTPKLVLTPTSKGELFVWCPWGFVRCWHSSSRIWVIRVCGSEGWSPNRLERGQSSRFVTGNSLDHFLAHVKRMIAFEAANSDYLDDHTFHLRMNLHCPLSTVPTTEGNQSTYCSVIENILDFHLELSATSRFFSEFSQHPVRPTSVLLASPRHNRIRRAPLNSSPPRARLVQKQNDVSCSWKCWSVRSSSLWMEIDDLNLQDPSKKIPKVVCFHPRKTWRMDSDKDNCNLLRSFWAWSELRHVYNDGSPASKACGCHLHVPLWRHTVESTVIVLIKTISKLLKWQLNFEAQEIKEMEDGLACCATVCEMYFMFEKAEAPLVSDLRNLQKTCKNELINFPLTSGTCPA